MRQIPAPQERLGLLIQFPVAGVVECRKQVDLDITQSLAESFKFIIIIEKRSWLFVIENLLIGFPECGFLFSGYRFAERLDNPIEFGIPECRRVERAVCEIAAPDDQLKREGFCGEARERRIIAELVLVFRKSGSRRIAADSQCRYPSGSAGRWLRHSSGEDFLQGQPVQKRTERRSSAECRQVLVSSLRF